MENREVTSIVMMKSHQAGTGKTLPWWGHVPPQDSSSALWGRLCSPRAHPLGDSSLTTILYDVIPFHSLLLSDKVWGSKDYLVA